MTGISNETRQPGLLDLVTFVRDLGRTYTTLTQRFSKWVEENQDGILAFFASMQLLAEARPVLEGLWDRWRETPWGHLLDELDLSNALGLLLLLDQQQDAAIERVLEPALTDRIFLREVAEALNAAPLPDENRRQLHQALTFMGQRDYALAVPLLIVPLEGAFWHVAETTGLVEGRPDGRRVFTAASGKQGVAHSVEALFEPLEIDGDFRSFLLRLVYSSAGNEFRHGNARAGWRRSALMLTISLVGWLDLYAESRERALLMRAFDRHDDVFGVAVEALPTIGLVTAAKPDAARPTVDAIVRIHSTGGAAPPPTYRVGAAIGQGPAKDARPDG